MSDNKIGILIAQLRAKNDWTQKEMADMLNVSDKTVSKWENSDGYPDTQLLIPIADLFKITADELLRGSVNVDFDDSMSNLEKATIRGKQAVESLINVSVDKIKTKDEYGKNLVDYALKYGDYELIKILLLNVIILVH